VAGAATVPATGSSDPLPETGAPLAGMVGMAAVVGSVLALRRSKRAVYAAARSQR